MNSYVISQEQKSMGEILQVAQNIFHGGVGASLQTLQLSAVVQLAQIHFAVIIIVHSSCIENNAASAQKNRLAEEMKSISRMVELTVGYN